MRTVTLCEHWASLVKNDNGKHNPWISRRTGSNRLDLGLTWSLPLSLHYKQQIGAVFVIHHQSGTAKEGLVARMGGV